MNYATSLNSNRDSDSRIPGPHGLEALRLVPRLRRNPIPVFFELMRRYGDIIEVGLPSRTFTLVLRPQHVAHVLKDNHKNYAKGQDYSLLSLFLGKGLLTSEGELWKRQRHTIQPVFRRPELHRFVPAMVRQTRKMLDEWETRPADQPFDVAAEMMHLTLRILGQTMFSFDLSSDASQIGDSLATAIRYINRRTRAIIDLSSLMPSQWKTRFQRAVQSLDQVIYKIIAHRREHPSDAADLLAQMMEASDEKSGGPMSDQQLRDELVTFLLAGHETTANALTWTLFLLSRHPLVEERLLQEVSDCLSGRPPTFDGMSKLRYTMMVLQEAMRLYPPAWSLQRCALSADRIGGYTISAGAKIGLVPLLTHRHPAFWHNPEAFDPERFSLESNTRRPRYSYFPFGAGPRQCIGKYFALIEAGVILTLICQNSKLSLAPGEWGAIEPMVTLRPQNGIWMTRQKR